MKIQDNIPEVLSGGSRGVRRVPGGRGFKGGGRGGALLGYW